MATNHQFEVIVEQVSDLLTFTGSFTKKELWAECPDGKYPQKLVFEFHKERADMLTNLRPGQVVTVHADVRGREHNGRRYISLVGWKVDVNAATPPEPADDRPGHVPPPVGADDELSDMPF